MSKKTIIFTIVALGVFCLPAYSVYSSPPPLPSSRPMPERSDIDEIVSIFRFYKMGIEPAITVPTVIEIPIDRRLTHSIVVARDNRYNYLPAFYHTETTRTLTETTVEAFPDIGSPAALNDGNIRTNAQFNVEEDRVGQSATITTTAAKPITSSELELVLDDEVALPRTIEVRADVGGNDQIVVAQKRMTSQRVAFPETTSDSFTVTFTYTQPLRINELRIIQSNVEQSTTRGIRFLAHPDRTYSVFYGADRYKDIDVGEVPDLQNDEGVVVYNDAEIERKNLSFKQADHDRDGVPDMVDNCVSVANPDQTDVNQNGRGDACDDFDRDGLINSRDNCPEEPNRRQQDTDGDGIGDACDGEESRFTEKYPWLPWAAFGIAALVLVVLTVLTMSMPAHSDEQETEGEGNDQ